MGCVHVQYVHIFQVVSAVHSPPFHCFIGFCLLLHTHLPTRLSGFYQCNLLVPLYLCVQDVITDETIEQQGYEDWVCSFPNICFSVSRNINYVCKLL